MPDCWSCANESPSGISTGGACGEAVPGNACSDFSRIALGPRGGFGGEMTLLTGFDGDDIWGTRFVPLDGALAGSVSILWLEGWLTSDKENLSSLVPAFGTLFDIVLPPWSEPVRDWSPISAMAGSSRSPESFKSFVLFVLAFLYAKVAFCQR